MRARVLLLLALPLAPTVAQGQGDGSPCLHPDILHSRELGQTVGTTVLYDGVAPLKRQPTAPIDFPSDIPDGSCVLLNVRFAEREGEVYVEDAGFMAVNSRALAMQMRRGNYGRQVVQAATEVIRAAVRQGLFASRPKNGSRHIMAVPIVSSHPLYARTAAAVAAAPGVPPTLRERGFPTATLVKAERGMAIYRLGERGFTQYFALVRPLEPDEAILDYVTGKEGPFTVSRYGAREESRFRQQILPLLRDKGERYLEVQVYHYAEGITIAREADSRFPWNTLQHFQTGELVEPPAAVERWDGRRRTSGGPFTWYAGGERGTSATDLNSIAAIQGVQQQMTALHEQQKANLAALLAREERELSARRAARRQREAERARLITRAGLIYLDEATWARYQLGPEMKLVFDGAWRDAGRDWEFGNIYARTIRAFSNRCRHLIPRGSPFQVSTPVSRDDYGNERRGTPDTTFIPAAFVEPYRWWDKNLPQALPLGPPGVEIKSADQVLDVLASPAEALQRIFSGSTLLLRVQLALREDMAVLFEGGCETPVVKQFMDNMRRLALGLPSLQQERAPQSLLRPDEWPLSLGDACMRHQTERLAQVGRDWCPCLERQLGKSMTLGDRWSAVEDYHRFYDEVEGLRQGADGQPVWSRYEPANVCRR